MKKLLLFSLLLLAGCDYADKVCNTGKPDIELVNEINGCKVYDVTTPQFWDKRSGGKACIARRFMMTDCRDVSLKWNCGKNCNMENHSK